MMNHKELKKPSIICLIIGLCLEAIPVVHFYSGHPYTTSFAMTLALAGLAILYLGLGMVVADGLLKPKGKEESTTK